MVSCFLLNYKDYKHVKELEKSEPWWEEKWKVETHPQMSQMMQIVNKNVAPTFINMPHIYMQRSRKTLEHMRKIERKIQIKL